LYGEVEARYGCLPAGKEMNETKLLLSRVIF
jgi:hypothetical protein